MHVNEFNRVIEKIKPFTDYVYLHVLGEPLLHPNLEEILDICSNARLSVNITTNGSLLMKNKSLLLRKPVRQINISLHDAEENVPKENWIDFIHEILECVNDLKINTYINLRFWNQTEKENVEFNSLFINKIKDTFILFEKNGRNVTLDKNVYLQTAPRFQWIEEKHSEHKTCYALKDHIAILSDGNIVPCCIDADANLLLGNIFNDDLNEILLSERARKIKNGFAKHTAVEKYCQTCGFRTDK